MPSHPCSPQMLVLSVCPSAWRCLQTPIPQSQSRGALLLPGGPSRTNCFICPSLGNDMAALHGRETKLPLYYESGFRACSQHLAHAGTSRDPLPSSSRSPSLCPPAPCRQPSVRPPCHSCCRRGDEARPRHRAASKAEEQRHAMDRSDRPAPGQGRMAGWRRELPPWDGMLLSKRPPAS